MIRIGRTPDLQVGRRGAPAARIVSAGMLRGLLEIGDAVARGDVAPDAPIVATSWLFGNRSLARLGFSEQRPAPYQILNLHLAILGIAIRLSFTRRRLTLPDLRRVRQVSATAGVLHARASEIRRLLEKRRTAQLETAPRSGLVQRRLCSSDPPVVRWMTTCRTSARR